MNNILERAGFVETREPATIQPQISAVKVEGKLPDTGAFYSFIIRTDISEERTRDQLDECYEAIVRHFTSQGIL